MSVTYPAAIPAYPDTVGSEVLGAAGSGRGLSQILDDYGLDITAIATKLGTGSSAAAAGKYLAGTGAGTSAWADMNKAAVGLGNVDNTSNATERAAVRTLTNARITLRNGTITSSSSVSSSVDSFDVTTITALAVNLGGITLTGTPTFGQIHQIRIKDNGTSRTLAWSSAYRQTIFGRLPGRTIPGKTLYITVCYNSNDAKWDVINVSQETDGPVLFSVYKSSTTALTGATWTKVTMDTELYDPNNNFASGTFTCTVPGYYQFNLQVAIGSAGISTTASALASIYKNGVEYYTGNSVQGSGNAVVLPRCQAHTQMLLAVGDTIEPYAWCGETRDVVGVNVVTYMMGNLIGQV